MKRLITLLCIIATASCAKTSIATTQDNSFVLTNINIVDTEHHTIHRNKSILVNAGKIQQIAETATALHPKTGRVIDGKGGYVTPGLIDMHVHMYEKAAFTIALSHGVTHVRIMNGVPDQLHWRDQVEAGQLIGSSATVSSPIISAYNDAPLHHTVHTVEQAQNAVTQFKAAGYDLIKVYGNLSEGALTAIVVAGRQLAMPVAKHGPHASGDMPVTALTGLQSLEHVEDIYQGPLNHEFAPHRLPAIAEAIKSTGVPVTPTLNIYYQLTMLSNEKDTFLASIPTNYTSDIIALEASQNQVKRWLSASENMARHNQKTFKFLQHITDVLSDTGVPLLVGSDSGVLLSPHGLATHNEMRLMHQAGLSVYEVLAAATINPAKALNLHNEIGKIAENYAADFIYSTANPVEEMSVLTYPDAVIKKGVWYSKEQLTALRENAIESRSVWAELSTLIKAL
ncbi:MAG: amidohydrolase family protein [Alteromonadaceae bacterium]|nr:amidohydrolase family protein [Alteromonadaceae bacterium]